MLIGMLSCSRKSSWRYLVGLVPQEGPILRGVSRFEEGTVTAVLTAPEYMSVLDVGEAPG